MKSMVTVIECKRCGHKWVPRIPFPALCPNCRSPYFNQQKKQKET